MLCWLTICQLSICWRTRAARGPPAELHNPASTARFLQQKRLVNMAPPSCGTVRVCVGAYASPAAAASKHSLNLAKTKGYAFW